MLHAELHASDMFCIANMLHDHEKRKRSALHMEQ
jgi:hypothetical protein